MWELLNFFLGHHFETFQNIPEVVQWCIVAVV